MTHLQKISKALLSVALLVTTTQAEQISSKGLAIVVAEDAPDQVRQAANAILASVESHPLLSVLADGKVPTEVESSDALLTAAHDRRALRHLVLVGLPEDPMVALAWQNEARREAKGFYGFGWGTLIGDIGWVESDRNPWLHSTDTPSAPFATFVITVSGSTPTGVLHAARALVQGHTFNACVAAPGWRRGTPSLLDRDPPTVLSPPADLPKTHNGMKLLGFSQPGADVYRGVLDSAGVEPSEIWVAKYWKPGDWDGSADVMTRWTSGLHRRAPLNAIWIAKFDDENTAQAAANRIANSGNFKKDANGWSGEISIPEGRPITLWQEGTQVFISSVDGMPVQ